MAVLRAAPSSDAPQLYLTAVACRDALPITWPPWPDLRHTSLLRALRQKAVEAHQCIQACGAQRLQEVAGRDIYTFPLDPMVLLSAS